MKNIQSLVAVAILVATTALEAGNAMRRAAPLVATAAVAGYAGYRYAQRQMPTVIDETWNSGGVEVRLRYRIQDGNTGAGTLEIIGRKSKNIYSISHFGPPVRIIITHILAQITTSTEPAEFINGGRPIYIYEHDFAHIMDSGLPLNVQIALSKLSKHLAPR